MAESGDKKVDEMEEVVRLTEDKTDVVSYWARRGVKSEAGTNISYLKRRIEYIKLEPVDLEDLKRCQDYLDRLNPIFEASMDSYLGLFS